MVPPTLTDLLDACRTRAWHLELRDCYGTSSPGYQAWMAGQPFDRTDFDAPWVDLIRATVARGVVVRRARVISEPVSDYIRYEHHATPYANLAGGEAVRWLPRHQAGDLALTGADFWLIDDHVLFVHQDGNGEQTGTELRTEPHVIELAERAFHAVWERGIDHQHYQPA
ncbi:hypothetical protein J5X84_39320 [Streptosporangiaceae bacterium NEAU-GS5]|nr:hypothetical protein [Streptosporangiaceae bacterium NEAU-GS5]